MKILNLVQGTPEWHSARAKHFTASEAPAMAGVSKYGSRNELLKQKKTGVSPEVSEYQQKVFADGHAAEAAARTIAERIIGEELFPCTAISDDHPHLLASFDGITMLEDVCWEHKLINDDLRQATAETLAEHYKVQMDQQLLVSGAERCLFMASDGTEEDCNWFWYESTPERFAALLAGWEQFRADLEAYEPQPEKVAATGTAPDSLPALVVELSGAVRNSNLADFKSVVMARIEAINTDLQTDQDFATAEKTAKFLSKAEKDLETAKAAALQQTASISELFRTIDQLKEQMRSKRLELNKLVKAEKENRRLQIVTKAKADFDQWLQAQDAPIPVQAGFDPAAAMKGKKTITTLQSAADDALAAAKVEARQIIERVKANHAALTEASSGYEFLFHDWETLVEMDQEQMLAVVKARILEHKAAEQERIERERERIHQEEQRKLAEKAEQEEAKVIGERMKRAEEIRASLVQQTACKPPEDDKAAPDTVTISRAKYEKLRSDSALLAALIKAGVEQWKGYAEATAA